jgi:hypothetical protein
MKLNWHDAPTRTEWGHDMVVATVALGKDHSADLYCGRSKTAEAEALLKKPWVGLTAEEQTVLVYKYRDEPVALCLETERKLKEKNNG